MHVYTAGVPGWVPRRCVRPTIPAQNYQRAIMAPASQAARPYDSKGCLPPSIRRTQTHRSKGTAAERATTDYCCTAVAAYSSIVTYIIAAIIAAAIAGAHLPPAVHERLDESGHHPNPNQLRDCLRLLGRQERQDPRGLHPQGFVTGWRQHRRPRSCSRSRSRRGERDTASQGRHEDRRRGQKRGSRGSVSAREVRDCPCRCSRDFDRLMGG